MRRIVALVLALAAACGATSEPRTTRFRIGGMVCDSCEQAICARVAKLEGVLACTADHAAAETDPKGAAEVRHDPARASVETIAAAIRSLGYTAEPVAD
ncbi:MAG TPA: heavy-metal-associated domain-containing protein [Nannocystis sp.]